MTKLRRPTATRTSFLHITSGGSNQSQEQTLEQSRQQTSQQISSTQPHTKPEQQFRNTADLESQEEEEIAAVEDIQRSEETGEPPSSFKSYSNSLRSQQETQSLFQNKLRNEDHESRTAETEQTVTVELLTAKYLLESHSTTLGIPGSPAETKGFSSITVEGQH
ncbi:unnamed protein product [Ilex paraguariensis]|uniref:Uncharacterized protein n=1 Tax=Ilex paraguariensis TaxID=185542 RepID=A0ABC8SZ09_9AQUA